jgi:hypothetical protein
MNHKKYLVNYLTFWRGEFANNYKKFPRLYKALIENNVFFEDKDDCLSVTFYVKNSIQQQWIEVNHYDDFVEKLLAFADCDFVELNIVSEDDLPIT